MSALEMSRQRHRLDDKQGSAAPRGMASGTEGRPRLPSAEWGERLLPLPRRGARFPAGRWK